MVVGLLTRQCQLGSYLQFTLFPRFLSVLFLCIHKMKFVVDLNSRRNSDWTVNEGSALVTQLASVWLFPRFLSPFCCRPIKRNSLSQFSCVVGLYLRRISGWTISEGRDGYVVSSGLVIYSFSFTSFLCGPIKRNSLTQLSCVVDLNSCSCD